MSQPLRLLLIEKHEDDALLIIRELRRQGFNPYWQRVVSELELRTSLARDPWDVILSDDALPGFSALAALQILQAGGYDTPFLIVSDTADESQIVSALKAGARDFIGKGALARLAPAITREVREAAARRERRLADERLVQSERYFRALIERAADLIMVLDDRGVVQDVSPAISSMLGYCREGLIGRPLNWLVHPDDAMALSSLLGAPAASWQQSPTLTLRAFHHDGSQHTLEAIITNLLADPAVAGVVINARDVTRHAEAEAQIRRQGERARALLRVAARLNAQLDRDTVIGAICEETALALGSDIACVLLPGPDRTLQVAGAAGPGVDEFTQMLSAMPDVINRLLADAQPVIVASPYPTSRELAWSAVGAQMSRNGQQVGLLVIAFADGARPISADDQALLGGLADQAGMALDNADLLARLKASNTALAAAYDATLENWIHALDLRDQETEGHTRRVTTMTIRLAQAMGFEAESLTDIYRGALLHDIGKLVIPDRILHKAGPLNDDEWALMRQHPTYAYEWLRSIPLLAPALDIPFCHHERWDGSGYPRGLRGEEIPLIARIFALVDVWDALRSERPYKPAYDRDYALQQIQALAGKAFDPEVVALFLRLLPELEEATRGET